MATLADQLEQMRSGLPSSQDGGESRLTEQLEQMRVRMNEVARREHEMAAELNAAVRSMDEQLLHEVRSITAAHEARRATILNELQMLAARLDGLPKHVRQRASIGAAPQGLLPLQGVSARQRPLEQHDTEQAIRDALGRRVGRPPVALKAPEAITRGHLFRDS